MTRNRFLHISPKRDIIHLLEVIAKFDHRSGLEHSLFIDHQLTVRQRVDVTLDEKEVRTTLDRQKAFARHINSVCVLEMLDRSTRGSLKLLQIVCGSSDQRKWTHTWTTA